LDYRQVLTPEENLSQKYLGLQGQLLSVKSPPSYYYIRMATIQLQEEEEHLQEEYTKDYIVFKGYLETDDKNGWNHKENEMFDKIIPSQKLR
jgi:hypothetical protein